MTNKGDLISRSYLHTAIGKRVTERHGYFALRDIKDIIDNAPTVEAHTPEQVKELVDLNKKLSEEKPQGEWIKAYVDKREFWFCKKCEYPLFNEPKTNFCPNCGADMRKGGAE